MLSELARQGIQAAQRRKNRTKLVNGFEVLPTGGRIITTDLVQRLLGETTT